MPAPRRAFYDFSVSPYSYDFLSFLAMSRAQGCDEVIFVPGERSYQKCTPEEQAFRLKNLLIPLAQMSGGVTVCESREEAKKHEPAYFPPGYTVDEPVMAHMFGQLIRSGKARWLKPSQEARDLVSWHFVDPVTITIRESRIKPLRNSKIGEWLQVAEYLKSEGFKVVFVPDTDNLEMKFGEFESYPEASLNPDLRAALYERALLNLGIGNGPMGLCMFQSYPYMVFRFHDEGFQEQSAAFLKANNLPVGSQLPWAKPNQRIVWEDDKAENIIPHLKQWSLKRAA